MPSVGALVRSLVVALALVSAFDAIRTLEHGAAGVVLGLVAVAVLAFAIRAIADPDALRAPRSTPRRERDPSALVAQSDPDAEGHARPRAPGFAAPAA